jgi:hypothetical protein
MEIHRYLLFLTLFPEHKYKSRNTTNHMKGEKRNFRILEA